MREQRKRSGKKVEVGTVTGEKRKFIKFIIIWYIFINYFWKHEKEDRHTLPRMIKE